MLPKQKKKYIYSTHFLQISDFIHAQYQGLCKVYTAASENF